MQCDNCHLKFFVPTVTGDTNFYAQLQERDWYYLGDKTEYHEAARHINKGDMVLDVGAGRGAFAKHITWANFTGLEFSPDAVRMAQREGINVVQESIEEHALQHEATYDVVCAFQVLEHVSNIGGFVHACVACVKPGGLLIFSIPSDDGFVGAQIDNVLNMPPHHVSRFSDECLKQIGNQFGITVVHVHHEPLSDMHIPSYAQTVVQHAILNLFKKQPTTFHPLFDVLPINMAVKLLRKVFSLGLHKHPLRPVGHSVTVVYQK
jgi:SAM-dependent methyltransferase